VFAKIKNRVGLSDPSSSTLIVSIGATALVMEMFQNLSHMCITSSLSVAMSRQKRRYRETRLMTQGNNGESG
jgi:hypothetical protein